MRSRFLVVSLVVGLIALAPVGARAAFPQDPPDDPEYGNQWNLGSDGRGIHANVAWQTTIGRSDVVVASLDSGVKLSHEDLVNKIFINAGEVAGNGVDDDGNGYVDDDKGWNFYNGSRDANDRYGHGTGTAGIFAAQTNNGKGVAGICPNCKILPVIIGGSFVGHSQHIGQAIVYATDRGSNVASMSIGSLGNSPMLRQAVDYATSRNVVLVAAMGNDQSTHRHYPVFYDDVVGVGALNANRVRKNFSNYGAHIDVSAPANVRTTHVDGGYADFSGTSSATPHVSGAVALVVSRAKDLGLALTPLEVKHILRQTAEDIVATSPYPAAAGWDPFYGWGRVHAANAVARVGASTIPPEIDIDSPDWYSLVNGTVTVSGKARAPRASSISWTLSVGRGMEPSSWTTVATGSTGVTGTLGSWNTGSLAEDLYTLRLTGTDNLGNTAVDRMAVYVSPTSGFHAGFPRYIGASTESPPTLVDLNGDNRLEIIFGASDGKVYAVQHDGTNLAGWPVSLDNLSGPSFGAGKLTAAPAQVLLSSPAVGDVNNDGVQEVFIGGGDGKLYAWKADGTRLSGWPKDASLNGGSSYPRSSSEEHRENAIYGSPALGDLDKDGDLEILVGSGDQRLYAYHHTGSNVSGFPTLVQDERWWLGFGQQTRITASPAVADFDADGSLEIAIGSNESYDFGLVFTARFFAFEHTGAEKWFKGFDTWFLPGANRVFPIVASGVNATAAIAQMDGDTELEIAIGPTVGDQAVLRGSNGDPVWLDSGNFGASSNSSESPSKHFNGSFSFADVDNDNDLDILAPVIGDDAIQAATDHDSVVWYDHLVAAWDYGSRRYLPAFPRVIEDFQMMLSEQVADIDGDGRVEILASSGEGLLHAFRSDGTEPAGWPKQTGGWALSSAVGDVDADGSLEVVIATREGYLLMYDVAGGACGKRPWPEMGHDAWNTSDYGRDAERPNAVRNLSGTRSGDKINLSWSAPGEDGGCGTASSYDVRYSTSPITTSNWGSATQVTGEPAPAAPGTTQTMSISSAPSNAHVAMRTRDAAGNWSAISNVPLVP